VEPIKILVTHQKGGVGKSTIAANLATYLAIQDGRPTALIDFDRQSSAARWIESAPQMGVSVFRPEINYQEHGQVLLSQFKRALNLFSQAQSISISDLTWAPSLSSEFLLEFDFILIPTALSKFDIASSEIFILEYLSTNLKQIEERGQQILVVPSKVAKDFNPQQSFLNLTTVRTCSVSPPIQFIPTIDQFVYEDFLCVASDNEVSKNFSTFGHHVASLIHQKIKDQKNREALRNGPIQKIRKLTVLDEFIAKRLAAKEQYSDVSSLEARNHLQQK
jgi:hypothetical protein